MDITPYVDSLRRDLRAAAEGASTEARDIAERLGFALDPAARLALMEAISQAATEITAAMPAGSVDVRLDGRDLDFVVDLPIGPDPAAATDAPAPPAPPAPPPPPSAPGEPVEDGVARVSLRLPESVKARAEEAATAAGQSLNTWLVAVVRAATEARTEQPLDVSSRPLDAAPFGPNFPFRDHRKRRMTGWI